MRAAPRRLEGVPEDQTPSGQHAGLAVANAKTRQRHAPQLVHRVQAEHQPAFELQGARTDPGGRARGRIEVDVRDAVEADFPATLAERCTEDVPQLGAVAYAREGIVLRRRLRAARSGAAHIS